MSALRGSRSAADASALMAASQSFAIIAFLPAAKSGSSCAQSAFSRPNPADVQIGQSSTAIVFLPGASKPI
jgi:hypothetical protein